MSHQIIPPSFLFHYSLSIREESSVPRSRGRLLGLNASHQVFVPSTVNEQQHPFQLRIAWNRTGLGVNVKVRGRRFPVAGRRSSLKSSDVILLCIDTRHTATVHRAGEFCSLLRVLPADEDANGEPSAEFTEISQQRTVRRDQNAGLCRLQTHCHSDGYDMDIWIPGSQLPGFDSAPEVGHIGFYCVIHDSEFGELPLNVGNDFPVTHDPSTWIPLELRPG